MKMKRLVAILLALSSLGFASARRCNSGTAVISLGTASAINITGDLTLSALFAGVDITAGDFWFVAGTDPATTGFISGFSGGAYGDIFFLTGSSDTATTSATWLDSTWRGLVITQSSTTVAFYKNGAADGTASIGPAGSYSGSSTICASSQTGQDYRLSDVVVRNVAITAGEAAALAKCVPQLGVRPGNIKGWWLGPSTGTSSEFDFSGNGNSGTVTSTSVVAPLCRGRYAPR